MELSIRFELQYLEWVFDYAVSSLGIQWVLYASSQTKMTTQNSRSKTSHC